MLSSIASRSVIVTGGSKGIGRGIAQVFSRKNAKVMIVARDFLPTQKLLPEFSQRAN